MKMLKFLIMDEADRILNMDFEQEVDKILRAIPRERKTYLFSATMTAKGKNWTAIGWIHVVGKGSWKKREVGKFEMKLERIKLESSSRSWQIFDHLILHWKISNFKLSNFSFFQLPFPSTCIPHRYSNQYVWNYNFKARVIYIEQIFFEIEKLQILQQVRLITSRCDGHVTHVILFRRILI